MSFSGKMHGGEEILAAKPYVQRWWKSEGVLGVSFATQDSLKTRIREIINRAEINSQLQGPERDFMLDVLRRHHQWVEKQGVGVRQLVVRLNPPPGFGSAKRGLWLVRTDESEVDISWVTSLQPGGANSAEKDVALAARREVSGQTRKLLEEMRGFPCPICGQPLLQIHIDHIAPLTFEHLLSRWLALEGIGVGEIDVLDLGIENTFANRELAARWMSFHQIHAKLRAIHPHENLSIKKRVS